MKGRVLVTGGLGYIGSHTAVELLAQGYEVVLGGQPEQHACETCWTASRRLRAHDPNGSKWTSPTPPPAAVPSKGNTSTASSTLRPTRRSGSRFEEPLKYYQNNLGSLMNLLDYVSKHPQLWLHLQLVLHRVWPSRSNSPSRRDAPVKAAESPYGNTKQIGEEIIREAA